MIQIPANAGVAAAMSQSVIFIGYDLTAKRLRERGVDSIALSRALRHALIPSMILLVLLWNTAEVDRLVHDLTTMLALAGFMISALLFQWVYFQCLHVAHSLTVASVARNAVGLPLLMLVGSVVNGDHPTRWGVLSLALMIAASFVKPGRTKLDHSQYIESWKWILTLSLAFVGLVTIKDPLYRLFMQRSDSLLLAVTIYMVIFSAALQVFFALRPARDQNTADGGNDARGTRWLLLLVPVFWMLGTIPEGVAFGLLPVYSMIAIGTVSWIIKIGSDIYFKRLAADGKTVLFSGLVVASIGLSIAERSII